jgi:hypothetical protein
VSLCISATMLGHVAAEKHNQVPCWVGQHGEPPRRWGHFLWKFVMCIPWCSTCGGIRTTSTTRCPQGTECCTAHVRGLCPSVVCVQVVKLCAAWQAGPCAVGRQAGSCRQAGWCPVGRQACFGSKSTSMVHRHHGSRNSARNLVLPHCSTEIVLTLSSPCGLAWRADGSCQVRAATLRTGGMFLHQMCGGH